MRKTVLALAVAGSVFAVTAAGAAGLTVTNTASSLKVANSGSGAAVTTVACNDAYEVTLNTNDSAEITSVTLTDKTAANVAAIPADCAGAPFVVSFDGGTTTAFSGTVSAESLASSGTGSAYDVASGSLTPFVKIGPKA